MQENLYLPSSSERKRAIVAYLLVGLFFFSGKEELTVYEYFHYKQAIGWYTTTMLFLALWIFLIWIPILRRLPFLFVLLNLILLCVFIVKAWRGEYYGDLMQQDKWKTIYADVGGWMLGIFEINKRVYGDISLDNGMEIDNLTSSGDEEEESTEETVDTEGE